MLEDYRGSGALVVGIPCGGVPVAAVIAKKLNLELDVVVASKITPSWNPEWGFGAMAFDGTTLIDHGFAGSAGLDDEAITEAAKKARMKVERRNRVFRGNRPFPDCRGRTVLVIDDGIATGVTVEVALEALRKAGAGSLIIGVPTGHESSVERFAGQVDAVYCPNVRGGATFAVAEAYEFWTNLEEVPTAALLKSFQPPGKTDQ